MEKEGVNVPFQPKPTRKKVESVNKSLYLSKTLAEEIEKIARDNNTSFNNVVVSMIEYCLKEQE